MSSPIVPGSASRTWSIRSSSPVASPSFSRPSRAQRSPNTSALERASPTASTTGQRHRHVDRPVRLGEVVAFEEGRRRQHDVGVQRGVGHHLLEHDREQILAFEAAQDASLIRDRDRRVAVVDEQHVDGRVVVLGQGAAEMIHVHQARVRLVGADPRPGDVPRRGIAHRIAAAADAELSADRRQREHRHRRVAAVAVPFEPPAAANQRRASSRHTASRPLRAPPPRSPPLPPPARWSTRPRVRAGARRRACDRGGMPHRRSRWRTDSDGSRAPRRRRCPA